MYMTSSSPPFSPSTCYGYRCRTAVLRAMPMLRRGHSGALRLPYHRATNPFNAGPLTLRSVTGQVRSQARSSHRSGLVTGLVRSSPVRSGLVPSGPVRSGQVRSGPIRMCVCMCMSAIHLSISPSIWISGHVYVGVLLYHFGSRAPTP